MKHVSVGDITLGNDLPLVIIALAGMAGFRLKETVYTRDD